MFLYAEKGTTVNLECPIKIPVNNLTWRGPPKLRTYLSGFRKADLEYINFLYSTKNNKSTLQIVNFTTENEGLYQCLTIHGGEETFNVTLFRKFMRYYILLFQGKPTK